MQSTMLTASQQPHKVVERAAIAGLSHGSEARVGIEGFHVGRSLYPGIAPMEPAVLHACNITGMEVVAEKQRGDGQPLSEHVRFDDRILSAIGNKPTNDVHLYDALMTCNGSIMIRADELTEVALPGQPRRKVLAPA